MNFCKEESATSISFPLVRVFWYNKEQKVLDVKFFGGLGKKHAEKAIGLSRLPDLNVSSKTAKDDENGQKIVDFIKTKMGLDSYLN